MFFLMRFFSQVRHSKDPGVVFFAYGMAIELLIEAFGITVLVAYIMHL